MSALYKIGRFCYKLSTSPQNEYGKVLDKVYICDSIFIVNRVLTNYH
jgi:hypothetical protein